MKRARKASTQRKAALMASPAATFILGKKYPILFDGAPADPATPSNAWTTSPAISVVDIAAQGGVLYLTPTNAGSTTLGVTTVDGKTGSVLITITSAPASGEVIITFGPGE